MGFPWGLDFGNQNCVVAIARKGGIDVIDNEASSRKTPCMVGLGSKERAVGVAGAAKINSNVKNTATDLKRLIGRRQTPFPNTSQWSVTLVAFRLPPPLPPPRTQRLFARLKGSRGEKRRWVPKRTPSACFSSRAQPVLRRRSVLGSGSGGA
ncbi:Hsp70 protein-domain-containing protein, partial [Baffinella frigidus]